LCLSDATTLVLSVSIIKSLDINISVSVIYLASINRYIAVYEGNNLVPPNTKGVAAFGRTPWRAIHKMTAKAKALYEPKRLRSKRRTN
jgi:hypothetical protein